MINRHDVEVILEGTFVGDICTLDIRLTNAREYTLTKILFHKLDQEGIWAGVDKDGHWCIMDQESVLVEISDELERVAKAIAGV